MGHLLDALRGLLGTGLPEGLTVLSPVYFDYGHRTSFGDGCFVNHGCYFMDGGSIAFGDHVFIGPFCGFCSTVALERIFAAYPAALPLVSHDAKLVAAATGTMWRMECTLPRLPCGNSWKKSQGRVRFLA